MARLSAARWSTYEDSIAECWRLLVNARRRVSHGFLEFPELAEPATLFDRSGRVSSEGWSTLLRGWFRPAWQRLGEFHRGRADSDSLTGDSGDLRLKCRNLSECFNTRTEYAKNALILEFNPDCPVTRSRHLDRQRQRLDRQRAAKLAAPLCAPRAIWTRLRTASVRSPDRTIAADSDRYLSSRMPRSVELLYY
jgi:hypothetical protein